jgi:hypothetical protein
MDGIDSFQQQALGILTSSRLVNALDLSKEDLRFIDQRSGEDVFQWGLYAAGLEEMVTLARTRSAPFFRYETLDHLTIATLGPYIFVMDPLAKDRRWLWTDFRPKPTYSEYRSHKIHPEDGSVRIRYQDWTQCLPRGGLISPSAVILLMRDAMIGVDPLTGKLLWRRPPPRSNSSIFHDGEHLFIIDRDAEGETTTTRVLNMSDGTTVVADLYTPLLKNRLIRIHGSGERKELVRLIQSMCAGLRSGMRRGRWSLGRPPHVGAAPPAALDYAVAPISISTDATSEADLQSADSGGVDPDPRITLDDLREDVVTVWAAENDAGAPVDVNGADRSGRATAGTGPNRGCHLDCEHFLQ